MWNMQSATGLRLDDPHSTELAKLEGFRGSQVRRRTRLDHDLAWLGENLMRWFEAPNLLDASNPNSKNAGKDQAMMPQNIELKAHLVSLDDAARSPKRWPRTAWMTSIRSIPISSAAMDD